MCLLLASVNLNLKKKKQAVKKTVRVIIIIFIFTQVKHNILSQGTDITEGTFWKVVEEGNSTEVIFKQMFFFFFKDVFWDSSRPIEAKVVVISGSFCWAGEETDKVSIRDSIHHILSVLKYYYIRGSDNFWGKKVFSPKNTKLFSLQITWNEFCTVLAHPCLLLLHSIFLVQLCLKWKCKEIQFETFTLDFNWIKTVTFIYAQCMSKIDWNFWNVCCICSLCLKMMDMMEYNVTTFLDSLFSW